MSHKNLISLPDIIIVVGGRANAAVDGHLLVGQRVVCGAARAGTVSCRHLSLVVAGRGRRGRTASRSQATTEKDEMKYHKKAENDLFEEHLLRLLARLKCL